MATQTKPLIALLLSAVIPGAGQIYNGEAKKGWVILACCLSLGAFTYWLAGLNKITIVLALLLLWLSAMVDAYRVAKTTGQAPAVYYAKTYVVTMLVLVGPVAPPLAGQIPKFTSSA